MFFDMRIDFFHYTYQKKSNEQVVNVLLISNEEKSHYCLIKEFNR